MESLLDELVKLILSNKVKKDFLYNKVIIKPVLIKTEIKYNLESFTDKQVFHQNLNKDEASAFLSDSFGRDFKQIDCFKKSENISLKISSSGKILKNIRKAQNEEIDLSHDRKKNYLLREGMIIPPLIDLGIMNKDGFIVKAYYHKFKQIEKFLEIIDDAVGEEKKLNIIDFGCGKSYLTFIIYYFLSVVKKMDVHILGLDLKEDVIRNCQSIKEKYHYDNLEFMLGDISLYKPNMNIDMIITLHACDTATDFALYHAIKYQAKYIFSVPCCQHEINNQLKISNFELISKYGLLKDRFSALLTDGIRANILEYYGYNVDVMEFVDFDLSPKNILLRATLKSISLEKKELLKKKIDFLIDDYKISQSLYNLTIAKEK